MKICPQAIRVLEDWGLEKKETQRAIQKSQVAAHLLNQGLKSPETVVLNDGASQRRNEQVTDDNNNRYMQQSPPNFSSRVKTSLSNVQRKLHLQLKVVRATQSDENAGANHL